MHVFEADFELGMVEMERYVRDFPWENRDAYASWLGQTHYFTRMTTRLLSLCGSLFDLDAQPLHERFLAHAAEERGHEALLLDDLRHLGRRIEDVPELPLTSAFYQVQYYWMEHVRPISFFGYILLLEGMAVRNGGLIQTRVEVAHGVRAAKFLKVHTQSDSDHVRQAIAQLKGVSADDARQIARNFAVSRRLYQGILTDIATPVRSTRSDAP